MATTHNLGFPRIGAGRELKFALERYWRGESDASELAHTASELRRRHWQEQSALDYVPAGDFSLYDQVLDTSALLGNLPPRTAEAAGTALDQYFRAARGRAPGDGDGVAAGEMTKWFDTNYHYIVPELSAETRFSLHADTLLEQIDEALAEGVTPKPVIIGPLTYLWLSKAKDETAPLTLLEPLTAVYAELLERLAAKNLSWVQIDEPILVTELDGEWQRAFEKTYHALSRVKLSLLLTTYFGELRENLQLACNLPVAGLHVDAVRGRDELKQVIDWLPEDKVLSLGVIDGRNIWKTDLNATLQWLEPIAKKRGDRLWLAPSCSLLHVPVTLQRETALDPAVKNWLAFACEKLDELQTLAMALNRGRDAVADTLAANARAIASRRESQQVHNPEVQARLKTATPALGCRQSPYAVRNAIQRRQLSLPLYPTTTIGSFPQTANIRKTRRDFKRGELNAGAYRAAMQSAIEEAIREQEKLGLDVLVHGEAERNDMVEYFGEQLAGFAFTEWGWVQSYGSRCVKPPIIFGDVSRPQAMTLAWIDYAQSLTDKPVKGMLTGPVTLLNWSFVRDDQPRRDTCLQLALAVRDEVLDLERTGVPIIQIDEAALREGLPLRRSQWQDYLDWAVTSFRIAANGVGDATQIHTHMCYSQFNDIIDAIATMDADVITIETSRSDMELLNVFDDFNYPNDIGPGVYDIHSPNTPSEHQVVQLMRQAARRIPAERLWINPDCGLKTRRWEEVVPALSNMVAAAHSLRQEFPDAQR